MKINEIQLKIDTKQLGLTNKSDCRCNSLSIALALEGIYYTQEDILLDSNALAFEVININNSITPFYMFLGTSSDMLEQFAYNTGIVLNHYILEDSDSDFERICDVITNGHCVMAYVEHFGLLRKLNPRASHSIPSRRTSPPFHTIVIYGFNRAKKQFLICETLSPLKKYHSVWINSSDLNEVRVCSLLNYKIQGDFFAIENIGNYQKPLALDMLNQSVERLKASLELSIPNIQKISTQIQNTSLSDDKMIKYLSIHTFFLGTTISFDRSGFFYRHFLKNWIASYCTEDNKNKLMPSIVSIADSWHIHQGKLNKLMFPVGYSEIRDIWSSIVMIAESEHIFCEDYIILSSEKERRC